jgi:valyl-tRNA synthetase
MLVHTDWPDLPRGLIDASADREMSWVTVLIDEIRSARAQMHVPVGLRLHMVHTEMSADARSWWGRNAALIQRLARIESLTEATEVPKGAITIPAEGATFAIPLAGIIDVAEEKARLTKALDKLGKEIGGLKGRLNNPNFAASAPEDVVMEAQANLEARQGEAAQLQAALTRLAEIG